MEDLINRQEAIEAIAEFIYYEPNMDGKLRGFDLSDWEHCISAVLSDISPAKPETGGSENDEEDGPK